MFSKDKDKTDGLQTVCKECKAITAKAFYENKRDGLPTKIDKETRTHKTCPRCDNKMLLKFFAINSGRIDGHSSWCIECNNIYWSEYRAKNKKKMKKKDHENYLKNIDKIKEYNREYHKNNPEKGRESSNRFYIKNKNKLNQKRKLFRTDLYKLVNMPSFKLTARQDIKMKSLPIEERRDFYLNTYNKWRSYVLNDTYVKQTLRAEGIEESDITQVMIYLKRKVLLLSRAIKSVR